MGTNVNMLIILAAFVVAIMAICVLYAIIIPRNTISKNDKEFQLTTKNILEHVKTLFDQGEYALVQLLAMQYLERMPSHVEVRQYLAEAYFKDKKYNNAIKHCLIVLKQKPGIVSTKKILGKCYEAKGMLSKAIKEYEELLEVKNDDIETLRSLAQIYKDTEQFYSAISAYNLLSGLLTDNTEIASVQETLAALNEIIHDYPAAFEAYKTRLGIYPTDVETNRKLAELYIKLHNHPKAIETLLYMLSFVTDSKNLLWIYEYLVDLYVNIEEYERAIEYSNKLLDIPGSDKFKIRENIAEYYLKTNNYAAGIGILEELVIMSQHGYDVTVELANAYIQQKEYQKALDEYTALLDKSTQKEAKTLRELICNLYIEWAKDLLAEKNDDEASKMLDLATDNNMLNSEIYYYKALIQITKRNYLSAAEFLNRSLEYDKAEKYKAKYLLKLAEVHHELGNFFEEKKALTDLLKFDPQNSLGLYHSGIMYVTQHDPKNAEDCFLKALEQDPNLIKAKFNLARLYENNNRDKAKELYMEILDADPSYEEAKSALSELTHSDFY